MAKNNKQTGGLVYSTDAGRMYPNCLELLGSDTNFAVVPSTAPEGRAVGSANLGSDPKNPAVGSANLGSDPNNSRQSVTPKGDAVVRVSHETKGRGGKSVTLVKGLALDALSLATIGKQLRVACGSGGTVKGGVIEIQGDHRKGVIAALTKLGHKVKSAGG